MNEGQEITRLLAAARDGDAHAWQRVVAAVYADLRRLAHRQLSGQRRDETLNTTGLVHECYLRIAGADSTVRDRGHFFALASRVMRHVIVDYARERVAEKRGGGARPVSLDATEAAELREAERYTALDDALTTLAASQERQARVVECRFFAGLSEEETAQALEISLRSVQRDWHAAREWLAQQLDVNEA